MRTESFLNYCILLLCMLVGGVNFAFATDFSFEQTSSSEGTLTGAPSGVTATFKSTYTTKDQLTGGNSMTLTIKGLSNDLRVTGIMLNLKTNKSAGMGSVTAKIGSTTIATYSVTPMGNIYKETTLTVTPTLATDDLVITIAATANSVYCNKFTISYEAASSSPLSSISLSGDYPTTFTEGDSFSHEGMTVTATYEDTSTKDVTSSAAFSGYDMAATGEQTVTVSYAEGGVTKTATYGITVNAIPTHTVTWSVNGTEEKVSYKEGETIVFSDDVENVDNKKFMGWTATPIIGFAVNAPEFVTAAVMGTSDIIYYAVFATVTTGIEAEVVDELDRSLTGITGSSYMSWSDKTASSGAVYAGQSAGSNESIQLRTTNNNSGVITTASGGNVKRIVVDWFVNTTAGRTLDIYGKNTAYSDATDLYNEKKQGTLLGSIVKGTSTELVVSGDYQYLGFRSKDGAMYLTSVSITWATGTPDTYSDYCTTLADDTREEAGISFAEESVTKDIDDNYTGQALINPNSVSPVVWTSSNEEVATVEDGIVTVIAEGETTITAAFAGNETYKAGVASYRLTVISDKLEAGLALQQESVSMNAGTEQDITELFTVVSDGAISYESADEDVASVAGGKLLANAPGETTITISVAATGDYKTASVHLAVTVTTNPDVAAFDPTATGKYKRVTDAATLADGDKLIIVNDEKADAMSTTQNTNNRGYASVVIYGDRIESIQSSVQVVTLEGESGAWYFNVGNGYLYAASSSSNYLRTTEEKTGNAKASISIVDGVAKIKFLGSCTHNVLKYNPQDGLFSCYLSSSSMSDVSLYRFESTPLTVGSAGWRTLVASENVKFPENVSAYIVTAANEKALLTKVSAVKAGEPVLVKAEPGSYTLTMVDDDMCDNTEANLLQVSVQNTASGYVLANKSNGVGFYEWAGGWMGAGRVYLPIVNASRAFVGFFFGDETTGIKPVESALPVGTTVYNLNGQRVENLKKGTLYIVNGRKVIRK